MALSILLTNDDGIYAPGLHALYQALKKIGDVTVVAPDSEKSSVGHGITLSHPIWYKKINQNKQFFGYAVSGTPADCVKFAINVILKKKPDIIISGINFGQNDGCSIFYSGTVAGAREGALLGCKSIAVSLATFTKPDFKVAAKYCARITRKLIDVDFPKGTFLNINIPHVKEKQIKGIKITTQGTLPIHGAFHKKKDPNLRDYYWMTGTMPKQQNDNKIDTFALQNNYITVTPIQCDTTDYTFIENLINDKF